MNNVRTGRNDSFGLFCCPDQVFVKYPDERGSKRMQLNVKVNKVYKDGNATKAICTVTLDEQFAVHGIKVIKKKSLSWMN